MKWNSAEMTKKMFPRKTFMVCKYLCTSYFKHVLQRNNPKLDRCKKILLKILHQNEPTNLFVARHLAQNVFAIENRCFDSLWRTTLWILNDEWPECKWSHTFLPLFSLLTMLQFSLILEKCRSLIHWKVFLRVGMRSHFIMNEIKYWKHRFEQT